MKIDDQKRIRMIKFEQISPSKSNQNWLKELRTIWTRYINTEKNNRPNSSKNDQIWPRNTKRNLH